MANECKLCSKKIAKKDDALQCELCDKWFHIKCEDISEEEYTFLGKHKSLNWHCSDCHKCCKRMIKLVGELEEKVNKIEERCVDLTAKINSLDEAKTETKSEIETMKKEIKAMKDAVASNEVKLETAIEAKLVQKVEDKLVSMKPTFANVVSEQLDSRLSQVSGDLNKVKEVIDSTRKSAEEEKDRDNRQNNIVIFRVPEVGDSERAQLDRQYCHDLVRNVFDIDIQDNGIKSIFRLGKKETAGGRPIMVQFRERATKNRVMESLIKLKDAPEKFKNIGISHDLMPSERETCKKMVAEAKEKQQKETGEYLWRVRGLPGQMKVVRLRKQ